MESMTAWFLWPRFEILLARAVGDVAVLGVHDVDGVPALLETPCAVVGGAGDVDDFLRGEGHGERLSG
jgi:hypothetical protein